MREAAKTALAIGAHPDDIEFYMAGTLLLLRDAGYETHYLNLSSGNCGSLRYDAVKTREIRRHEAQTAAALLGATWHVGFTDDLEILYELELLRRLAAVIREVSPAIVLTHSPQDYMEDHMITCRLAVTAAFARGMPNFRTIPSRRPFGGDTTVYHAMPHGLTDELGKRIVAGVYVNTTRVQAKKLKALSAHQSQQDWLDASQGLNSYLATMDRFSRALGRRSRRFKHAEGWRRHAHLGFCPESADPLKDALGRDYLVNRAYERGLK